MFEAVVYTVGQQMVFVLKDWPKHAVDREQNLGIEVVYAADNFNIYRSETFEIRTPNALFLPGTEDTHFKEPMSSVRSLNKAWLDGFKIAYKELNKRELRVIDLLKWMDLEMETVP